MALLIDTPRWPWRGRLWAHLISDESIDELHHAARELGLRWLSFGRDHYDVPDTAWADACALAELVDSREIVRSLRRTGLRVAGGKPQKAWRWTESLPAAVEGPEVRRWLDRTRHLLPVSAIEVLHRPGEHVVLHQLDRPDRPDLGDLREPPIASAQVIETVADGRYSVELVLGGT